MLLRGGVLPFEEQQRVSRHREGDGVEAEHLGEEWEHQIFKLLSWLVRAVKELPWCLAVVVDHIDDRVVEPGADVIQVVQINGAIIGEVEKHIAGVDGLLRSPRHVGSPLLAPEHQVDPVVEIRRDVVTLQRLPVDADKLLSAAIGPGGERDVVDDFRALALERPEVDVVGVVEEVGEEEELGDQFFHVAGVGGGGDALPRRCDRPELPVRAVEAAILQEDVEGGERFEAEEVPEHRLWVREVCPEVPRGALEDHHINHVLPGIQHPLLLRVALFRLRVLFFKVFLPLGCLAPHVLLEVAVHGGVP
jgi:hypothetical protein